MSIEQVRKVLDKHVGEYGIYGATLQSAAAEIDALYASERGGDDDAIRWSLEEALVRVLGRDAKKAAAAILRAIDARVGAKATAERELQLAKNKLCAIGNTLASKPSDYEGRAVDGVTLKGASGNVLFNSDAQVAP